jgi:hypothetical protein
MASQGYNLEQTGSEVQGALNKIIALDNATTEAAGLMSANDKAKLDGLPSGSSLETALGGKVDKVNGKGLSENDYTDAEKTKLAGIESGAKDNIFIADLDNPSFSAIAQAYESGKTIIGRKTIGQEDSFYSLVRACVDVDENFLVFVRVANQAVDCVEVYPDEIETTNQAIPSRLSQLRADSDHRLVTDAEKSAWNGKQAALVSGTNIKTVNGNSILGSGNLDVTQIFVAEYEVTTYAQVTAAITAGKAVFAKVTEGGVSMYIPLTGRIQYGDDSYSYMFELAKLNGDQGGTVGLCAELANSGGNAGWEEIQYFSDPQADWNQSDSSEPSFIKNKPTIPDVSGKADKVSGATNGNFAGLDSNGNLTDSGKKASDFLTQHQDISGKEDKTNKVSSWQSTPDDTHYPSEKLVKDSLDGKQPTIDNNHKLDYGLLSNTPTIPDAQIQSDWNQSDNTKKDYIKNKPTIPAAQVQSDWNESDTSSKAYIANKPTIPTVPVQDVTVGGTSVVSSGTAAIPAIPDVPTPTAQDEGKVLTADDEGNMEWQTPASGGDTEAIEVAAAALCDLEKRKFEKANLVDQYDTYVPGAHEKVGTHYALWKLYKDFMENEEIIASAFCQLNALGALASAVAPRYDRGTRTFAVDDCCMYENEFYRCTTAVPTPEPFDATKWVKTNLFDEMVRRFNAI